MIGKLMSKSEGTLFEGFPLNFLHYILCQYHVVMPPFFMAKNNILDKDYLYLVSLCGLHWLQHLLFECEIHFTAIRKNDNVLNFDSVKNNRRSFTSVTGSFADLLERLSLEHVPPASTQNFMHSWVDWLPTSRHDTHPLSLVAIFPA